MNSLFSPLNISLKILPRVSEEEIYPVVDKVIELIQASGVKYLVGPTETTMEGDWDTIFDIIKRAHLLCFELGAGRVLSLIQVDMKAGGVTMDEKIYKYR